MAMVMATSGWGACSGTQTGTWTASSSSYSKTNQTVRSDAQDYYTITVTADGSLTLTVNNKDNAQNLTATLYPDNSCASPSVWSEVANKGETKSTALTVAPGTYTLYIVGSNANNDTDYNISASYTNPYANDNVRSFSSVFSTNKKGDIKIIGNSSSCKNSGGNCVEPTTTEYNQAITTKFYKLSGDPATIVNSSSADLSLPAGRTILWAGLYWQGSYYNTNDIPSSTVVGAMKNVKIKAPGMNAYQTLSSQENKFNWAHNNLFYYQGMKEITDIVKTYGDGAYAVADINATTGSAVNPGGNIAAWSIVVVYGDESATLKNLTVFDGFDTVPGNVTASLSGFLTPSNGAIDAKMVLFAGEGDRSPTGDSVSLTKANGTACSLGTNILNSSVTDPSGNNITARTPAYANTIGIDIDTYNIGSSGATPKNCIGNNQTSTTITFASADDIYQPGMVATAIQIYAPYLEVTKTPSTSAGAALASGTQIDYTASFTNSGQEVAKDVVIFDDLSQNLLQKTDGTPTNPPVYLTNVIDRDANRILRSIRLSSANSTTSWHCPSGLSGISGCTVYDANCSVTYTGAAATTATKVQCSVPTVAIGATYTMKFSLNLAAQPDTGGQDVKIQNQIFASYKDNVTNAVMPDAASNVADAGNYLNAGSLIESPRSDRCGMFPSVLTAQNNITASKEIVCSASDPGSAGSLNNVINTTTINAGGTAEQAGGSCTVSLPPQPLILPTFLHSSLLASTVSVNAATSFSGANVGNISVADNDLTLTFTATSQLYSDSSTKGMKIGAVNDNNRQNITYVFNEGDYWIESWFMNGNNANIQINGRVRFFIANNFEADSNTFSINTPTSGVASNFYMYSYNDILFLSNGFANSKIKGYLYAVRDIVADGNSDNQAFTGALRAGRNIDLQQNQTFYYDLSGINGGADNCIVPNYTRVGLFDAWDISRSITDRKISTKISAQPFTLTIASLKADNMSTELKSPGMKAYYRLFDFQTNTPKTDYVQYDPSLNASIVSSSFPVDTAHKNMKVEFKFCADDNGTAFILKSDSSCSGMNVCTQTNRTCYRETVSTDAFAIRPNRFTITDVAASNLLKAGESIAMTIHANPYGSTGETADYNQSSANLTISAIKRMKDDTINNSLNGTASFPSAFEIVNGLSSGGNMTFSDVGRITVDLNDTEWTSIDAADTTLEQRTIHGEGNYTYIPFQFSVSNVHIIDTNNTAFTYLSNDLTMSAKLEFDITAQNKQGNTTTNFASGTDLYENPLTITPAIIDAVGGNAQTIPINNILIGGFLGGAAHVMWDDVNTTRLIRFNYNRPAAPINPIEITPGEVTLPVSSTYTDGATVTVSNSAANQNGTTNGTSGNAVFLYGRADAPDYRFSTVSGCGRIYFEFYNTIPANPIVTGVFGAMPPLSLSPDRNWYQNTDHNTSLHGSVTTLAAPHINATGITGCVGTSGLGTQKRGFVYDTQMGYPYRATISMDASDWLDTSNSNFGVEYRQAGVWIGVQSETATKSDANSELNTNRRVTW